MYASSNSSSSTTTFYNNNKDNNINSAQLYSFKYWYLYSLLMFK